MIQDESPCDAVAAFLRHGNGCRRRELILGVLPGAAIAAAAATSGRAATLAASMAPDLDRLLLELTGSSSDLARACLAALDDQAAPSRCRSYLALALPLDVGTLRQMIAKMKANDLAVGDIVVVDGWVLARTEAELLALAALCDHEVLA